MVYVKYNGYFRFSSGWSISDIRVLYFPFSNQIILSRLLITKNGKLNQNELSIRISSFKIGFSLDEYSYYQIAAGDSSQAGDILTCWMFVPTWWNVMNWNKSFNAFPFIKNRKGKSIGSFLSSAYSYVTTI